jgi:hypothetical protein
VSYWDLRNDPTCAFWAPLDGNLNDVRPGALNGTFVRDIGPTTPQYASGLFGRQAFSVPTGYGSGGNYGNGGAQFPAAAGGTADQRTVLFRFRPAHNLASFGRTIWQDNNGAQRQWRFTYHTSRQLWTSIFGASVANSDDLTFPAQTAGIWLHVCRRGGGGVVSGRINGVTSTGSVAQAALFDSTYNFFVGRGEIFSNGQPGLYQDVAVFNRHLSDEEADEYQAGPEPLYTVNPTASVVDGQLVGTTGTASAEGNGTVTYNVQWEQLLASQFEEVDGATGLTLASPVPGRVYRLRSEAANSGGKHRPAYSNLVSVVVSPNVIRQSLYPVRQQAYQQPTRVKTGYVTIRPSANYVTIGAD